MRVARHAPTGGGASAGNGGESHRRRPGPLGPETALEVAVPSAGLGEELLERIAFGAEALHEHSRGAGVFDPGAVAGSAESALGVEDAEPVPVLVFGDAAAVVGGADQCRQGDAPVASQAVEAVDLAGGDVVQVVGEVFEGGQELAGEGVAVPGSRSRP